jgi:hypothetical protein
LRPLTDSILVEASVVQVLLNQIAKAESRCDVTLDF